MIALEISRYEVLRIRNYCRRHKTFWCVAKDDGAYVCAPRGFVMYFDGCNPNEDDTWRNNASREFGDGSFSENLPLDWLEQVAADPTIIKMRIVVSYKARVAVKYERAIA